MARIEFEETLRKIEPGLPSGMPIADAWVNNSLTRLVTRLLASEDLKSEEDANEIKRFAFINVKTSVDKINGAEEVMTDYLKKYERRSRDFVDSLLCAIIGSTARFEAESQSDIDIDLIIEERISSFETFRTYVKEVRKGLNRKFKDKKERFLSFCTEHTKPYPASELIRVKHIANMIIGYHPFGDPSRLDSLVSDCLRRVGRGRLIRHLAVRAKNEIDEMARKVEEGEECDAVHIGYTVMMYVIRILALKCLETDYLCKPIPKPYWKICDRLYRVRGIRRAVLRQCSQAILHMMRLRYKQDLKRVEGEEYFLIDGEDAHILWFAKNCFDLVADHATLVGRSRA